MTRTFFLFAISSFFFFQATAIHAQEPRTVKLTDHLTVIHGAINGALIEKNGVRVVINGDPRDEPVENVDLLIFTHYRRDVVWAGKRLAEKGVKIIVPEKERIYFERSAEHWLQPKNQPNTASPAQTNQEVGYLHAFWDRFAKSRFHDYEQQTSKIITEPLDVFMSVKDKNAMLAGDVRIVTIETPGYTRGAVSYKAALDGKTVIFCGDLIYGNGQILDLYSLQDAIPDANLRGYHGYMARAADVIRSLQKILEHKPDLLIPAHGPVIENPQESINLLIERLRKIYHNYLSTSALRWYFGEDHIQACADRILGKGQNVDGLVHAETVLDQSPIWVKDVATSRIIISESGSAVLVDCGYQSVIDHVQKLIGDGVIQKVDAIYVTHYHNDHTDMVNAAAKQFNCPVYACEELKDILQNPGAYRMPALTDVPIENIRSFKNGETLDWNEFTLTFSFFPGQTYYHGGLLAKKEGEDAIFFIGDSFTPSGLDDYCLLNRNLIHRDSGYFLCLDILSKMDEDYVLINEHVKQPFRFSKPQLQSLITAYQERYDLLAETLPWDDPNYGIDENWARILPYGNEVNNDGEVQLEVKILNHSSHERQFTISPNAPKGWNVVDFEAAKTIPASTEGSFHITLKAEETTQPGIYVVTTDIKTEGWDLREWAEGIIELK